MDVVEDEFELGGMADEDDGRGGDVLLLVDRPLTWGSLYWDKAASEDVELI